MWLCDLIQSLYHMQVSQPAMQRFHDVGGGLALLRCAEAVLDDGLKAAGDVPSADAPLVMPQDEGTLPATHRVIVRVRLVLTARGLW